MKAGIKRLDACHFDIVRGCQLRCVGCPNSTLLPKVERIPVDLFHRCLRNIDVDEIGVLRLFNYGEPLLHDDLPGILRAIADQRWSVGLVELSTNAQHADWEQLERALDLGVLGRIVVSCDGDASAESYEMLRPPGKWAKLLEFLKGMAELRARSGASVQLMTRTTISRAADMERWNELLVPLGWTPEFRGWKYLPRSAANMTGREIEPGAGVCKFLAPGQCYVDADGVVVPCCAYPRAAELGSLAEQTLSAIEAGDTRRRFEAQLATDRESHPICSGCEYGPPEAPGRSAGANLPF